MAKRSKKSISVGQIIYYFVLVIAVIILVGGYFWRQQFMDWWWQYRQPELPLLTQAKQEDRREKIEDSSTSSTSQPQLIEIPAEINLAVPFTSQAPFARWDQFDEEMCEEASLLMVNRFYQNREFLSKDDAENALKEIQQWEEENLGVWQSTNSEEIVRTAKEMLGFGSSEVILLTDFSQIKAQIALGHPVILPAAGRELKNPNFKQPGPLYHMLVVRGWLADGRVITNDPGTRRGEGYLYDEKILWNAIHDWNLGDVDNGQKVMIVVK